MAVNVLADNSAALSLLLGRRATDNINWASTLIHITPFVRGTGKAAYFTAKFSGQSNKTGQAEATRVSYSDAGKEVEVAGNHAWKEYAGVVSVSALNQAATNATKRNYGAQSLTGATDTLMKARLGDTYRRIVKGLNIDMFTSTGASGDAAKVEGLVTQVDGTGTAGGLAQGTYSEWAAVDATASLSDLSFDQIDEDLLTPIYEACGETPPILMTDPGLFRRIRALYGSNAVPYIKEIPIPGRTSEDGVVVPARKVALDAGMEAFTINGGSIVMRDVGCADNTLYALNPRYLYLTQLLDAFTDFMDPVNVANYLGDVIGQSILMDVAREIAGMVKNPTGIIPNFKMLGATGASDEAMLFAHVAFQTDRRNAHGKCVYS